MSTMENLLQNQKTEIDQLLRLIENYKKDGGVRKHERYLKDKLETFNECYRVIKENNEIIEESRKPTDIDQPYFTQNTFVDLTKKYDWAILDVRTRLNELSGKKPLTTQPGVSSASFINDQNPLGNNSNNDNGQKSGDEIQISDNGLENTGNETRSPGDNESITTETGDELNLLNILYNELMDCMAAARDLDGATSYGFIEATMNNLNAVWTEFRSEYLRERAGNGKIEFSYANILQKYMKIAGNLNDIIKMDKSKSVKTTDNQFSLPKLRLHEFNGKISEWKSFIANFDRMIHNNTQIDDGMKIEYLKMSIRGDAAKLIMHIDPNPENYHTCYNILKKRYENKRELLNGLIASLVSLPKIKYESANHLKSLHDNAYEFIMSIKSIGVSTENWDPLLTYIISSKLDPSTIVHYECQLVDVREPQNFVDLLLYIEGRFMALQSAALKSETFNDKKTDEKHNNSYNNSRDRHFNSDVQKEKLIKCIFCSDQHSIFKCKQFEKQSVSERYDWIKAKKLCVNCFGVHKVQDCKSKYKCKTCQSKHNTLIHFESRKSVEKPNISTNMIATNHVNTNNVPSITSLGTIQPKKGLLATAMVAVVAQNGDKILLRALIDEGSEGTFITSQAVQTLKLKMHQAAIDVTAIGETTRVTKHMVNLVILPRFESTFVLQTSAIIMRKLATVSGCDPKIAQLNELKNLTLADPSFMTRDRVDLVLGSYENGLIAKPGLIKTSPDLPIARDTELGWIVSGGKSENTQISANVVALITNVELENKISEFFKNETFNVEDKEAFTEEEELCESHYTKTHTRDIDGRYIVTIPFKRGISTPILGNSKRIAMASLFQMEKRFEKNSALHTQYSEFIHEYIRMNHMKRVSHPHPDAYYMPHHCVYKDSTTTKLRVVFNASQKTSNGNSLNDQLAMGPIIQDDLYSILIRWRKYKIVFTADVEKMYRQILVNKSQTHLQRILWRDSPNEPITEYELTTVTYGTANAPYLAIRTLNQLAMDGENEFPKASKIIKKDFYVDDNMSGADSVEEAIELYQQLSQLMASAGFNLRKWSSNCPQLLEKIPIINQETQAHQGFIKALGVNWSPSSDEFSFNLKIQDDTIPKTKRQLYSQIASIHDPIGWITPVVIAAKHIIQLVWKNGIDWDDEVPEKYIKMWCKLKNELNLLNEIKINRSINYSPTDVMELHGFSDASEVGYSAVIYIKNVTQNTVRLLTSKARVSPIKEEKNDKNVTIPRLELCGALLLAELVTVVKRALEIEFHDTFLWTDSQIVLDWLNADPKRYKVFIKTRLEKINRLIEKRHWNHVGTKNNAADCASRGMLPSELLNHQMWFNGPEFLYEKIILSEVSEAKNQTVSVYTSAFCLPNEKSKQTSLFPNEYNSKNMSFDKLKRIIAYCFRFAYKKHRKSNFLTLDELQRAENAIIHTIQHESFSNEIRHLKKGNDSSKHLCQIKNLCPFLDNNGLLRVGGRLKNANLAYNSKHQLLLSHKHFVTKLIIKQVHKNCLHGGPRHTESEMRREYWLTNSQRTIKSVIRDCVTCFRAKPRPMNQVMAHLPGVRVNSAEKPFANTAIDYTGAINVKITNGRGYKTQKGYIAIFVCMTVKAIHVEAVSDMTADAFIAALRRFIARRGTVKNIYSDNGTNFVRSNKILTENLETIGDENLYHHKICNELKDNKIRWHFSPPGGPHFNGLAEAAVKSVKFHLKRTMSDAKLTFEELSTLLSQIESCVNSRPICTLSSDPNDFDVLTPSHFLIGEQPTLLPEQNHLESKANWLTRWQKIQQLSQQFWRRWQDEYLHQLQVRSKWFQRETPPQINEFVLISNENTPPSQWPVGRIIDTHPGDDELTRVVTVKTSDGQYKRPITKICRFPGDNIVNTNFAAINKHKKTPILPIIVAFLSFCVSLSHQYSGEQNSQITSPITTTQFHGPPGLYFERYSDVLVSGAEWNILAYLDLRGMADEYFGMENNLNKMRNMCTKSLTEEHGCNIITSHLFIKLTNIRHTNSLIFGSNREKRALLNIVGNIASDLFGVLDSQFAEKYTRDMTKLLKNDNHLMSLIKNHTSVIESTLNIVKHNGDELEKQAFHFNQMVERIQNNSDQLTAQHNFDNAALYLSQIMSEYGQRQNEIINVISNTKKNVVSHTLITPFQIENQMELMAKNIGNKYTIPREIDFYSIGKIIHYKLNNQYIFKLTVPLFKPQKFRLFEVSAIPFKRNNEFLMIRLSTNYLLTSIDGQYYQNLKESTVRDCIPLSDGNEIICHKPNFWYTADHMDCVWNLYNHFPGDNCILDKIEPQFFVKELKIHNKFVFVTNQPKRITVFCGESATHEIISGEGILSVQPTCTIKNNHFSINSKQYFANEPENSVIIPNITIAEVNLTQSNFALPELKFTKYNVSSLQSILNDTKANQHFTEVSYTDVHHYAFIYLIIIVLIALSILFINRYKKLKTILSEQIAPITLGRHVSMPNIA